MCNVDLGILQTLKWPAAPGLGANYPFSFLEYQWMRYLEGPEYEPCLFPNGGSHYTLSCTEFK